MKWSQLGGWKVIYIRDMTRFRNINFLKKSFEGRIDNVQLRTDLVRYRCVNNSDILSIVSVCIAILIYYSMEECRNGGEIMIGYHFLR